MAASRSKSLARRIDDDALKLNRSINTTVNTNTWISEPKACLPPLGRHSSSPRCRRLRCSGLLSATDSGRRRSVAWRLHWPTATIGGSSNSDASGSDHCRQQRPPVDVIPETQRSWRPSPSTSARLLSYPKPWPVILLLSVLDFFVFIGGDETRVAVLRNMILSSSTRSGTYAHTLLLMVALLMLLH